MSEAVEKIDSKFPSGLCYLVRGHDGEYTLSAVTFDLETLAFYHDGQLAMKAPDNAWILPFRDTTPIAKPPEQPVPTGAIPEDARAAILASGQNQSGRYVIIDGQVYDSEKGAVVSLPELAAAANNAHQENVEAADLQKKMEHSSEMLIMTDIDKDPVITVTKPVFDSLMQRDGWSAVMCSVIKKPIGKTAQGHPVWEDYRYEIHDETYQLRRCRLDHISKGPSRAMEMTITRPDAVKE